MKNCKKHIVCGILLCVLLTSAILNAFAASNAEVETIVDIETEEIVALDIPEAIRVYTDTEQLSSLKFRLQDEEQDLCSATFEKADGTKILYSFEKPIKYVSQNGTIRDKSTALTLQNGDYCTLDNDVKVTFSGNSEHGVILSYQGSQIKMVPEGVSSIAKHTADSNSIIYTNEDKSIIWAYTPLLDGVKEDIVLLRECEVNALTFRLYTNGARLVNENGSITLVFENGRFASFSSLVVYDTNGYSCTTSMGYETVAENQEYVLTIDLAELFEKNPQLQYPVTIDPTITVCQGETGIEHAMVYSGYPNTTNMCTVLNETRHTVGYYDSARRIGYELIRFPGLYQSNAFMGGSRIINVTYYQYYVPRTVTPTVTAYLYNGTWSPETIKYQNLSGSSTQIRETVSFTSTTGNSPVLCSLDLTEYAIYWKGNESSQQKGIILKNSNNSSSTYCAIFMANEVSSTQYNYYSPHVVAEYTAKKVMLDAGHYIGANQSPTYTPYYEGTKMWDFHLYLKTALEQYGFEVGTTRTDAQKNQEIGLTVRGQKAQGYDLFLSLHSNANDDTSINRVDVYYDVADDSDEEFARLLGAVVKETMNVSDYTARQHAETSDPSINKFDVMAAAALTDCPLFYLIEHSFHTNENSARWLYSNANLQRLAAAEASVINEYFKGRDAL